PDHESAERVAWRCEEVASRGRASPARNARASASHSQTRGYSNRQRRGRAAGHSGSYARRSLTREATCSYARVKSDLFVDLPAIEKGGEPPPRIIGQALVLAEVRSLRPSSRCVQKIFYRAVLPAIRARSIWKRGRFALLCHFILPIGNE